MKNKNAEHLYDDEKPWGRYEILMTEHSGAFQVKRVELKPHSRLSLQKHSRREEFWTVVTGEGVITVGENDIPVRRGSTMHIPCETPHRMANTGDRPLVFIEVQLGDYLGEDDIVRIQDDFNRT